MLEPGGIICAAQLKKTDADSHRESENTSTRTWLVVEPTHVKNITLPQSNIFAPENRPGPKRKRESSPSIHFSGAMLGYVWGVHIKNN